MKQREIFSELRIPGTAVVRIDGRRFGQALRNLKFDKPYDLRFAEGMAESAEAFFLKSGMNPSLAYIFSDEVNLLFVKDLPFNGRLEKLDSIIPSFFSAALVIALNSPQPLSFDSRVAIIHSTEIIEYLNWRQEECWRNLIHSYCYYLLRDDGMGARQAAEKLKGMKSDQLHELAWDHGINLAQTPSWQRRGILIYKKMSEKAKSDHLTGKEIKVHRPGIIQDWELPIFKTETGSRFIENIIQNPGA